MEPALEDLIAELRQLKASSSEIGSLQAMSRSIELLYAHDLLTLQERGNMNKRLRNRARAKIKEKRGSW